jgi:membrane protein required for colicin V production
VTAFDYAVFAVIGASVFLGLWRGVVSEMLALAAWVVGFLVARAYAGHVAAVYGRWIADPTLRYGAGFATVVVAVLVVFGVGRVALAHLLRAVGLGLIDRFLGAAFGVARGVVIALAAVMLAGMTPLPKERWWRDAALAPPLETGVIAMKPWLPPEVAKRIRYR